MAKRKLVLKISLIIILIPLLLTGGYTLYSFGSNYFVHADLEPLPVIRKEEKILLFAPHNDDEILGAGGLLQDHIAAGGQVKVVLLTNGDGNTFSARNNKKEPRLDPQKFINLGYIRQQETIAAMKALGLAKDEIIFLGYPDRGINKLWENYWQCELPYLDPYTQSSHSPYINSFRQDTAYCGENLALDIQNIIAGYQPDWIIMPHPNDYHPDHRAAFCFVKYALAVLDYQPQRQLLYLVHQGNWPLALLARAGQYTTPPAHLLASGTKWYSYELDEETKDDKKAAINQYKSQLKLFAFYLRSYARDNELLGEIPDLEIKYGQMKDDDIVPCKDNSLDLLPFTNKWWQKPRLPRGIYGEISNQGNLNIFLFPRTELALMPEHRINIILINAGERDRVTIRIRGRSIQSDNPSFIDYGGRSNYHTILDLFEEDGFQSSLAKRVSHLIIPGDSLKKYRYMFINTETRAPNRARHRSAWQMIKLKRSSTASIQYSDHQN
jgi:LmbE family N-acetylglucosaminyl deacetylase